VRLAHTEALAEAEHERPAAKDLAVRPNPDVVPANRGAVTTDVHRSLVDYAYDARHSGKCYSTRLSHAQLTCLSE
jgi:hypothetical protein